MKKVLVEMYKWTPSSPPLNISNMDSSGQLNDLIDLNNSM